MSVLRPPEDRDREEAGGGPAAGAAGDCQHEEQHHRLHGGGQNQVRHCVIIALCHHVTVSPHHCVTLPLSPSIYVTKSLCQHVIVSPFHCVTKSLSQSHCVTMSLHYCILPCQYVTSLTKLLCNQVTETLCHQNSVMKSLCHQITVLPCNFVTMSQSHCVTKSLLISKCVYTCVPFCKVFAWCNT